jgi:hypothetical protein
MESNSPEPDAKRRKLRKGTRSCWECKRRKVKCEFSLPTDEVCINCRRRGSQCISQEFPEETSYPEDNHGHLEDRLLKVEALLSQLVKKVGQPDSSDDSRSSGDASVLTPSPTVYSDMLPLIPVQRTPPVSVHFQDNSLT